MTSSARCSPSRSYWATPSVCSTSSIALRILPKSAMRGSCLRCTSGNTAQHLGEEVEERSKEVRVRLLPCLIEILVGPPARADDPFAVDDEESLAEVTAQASRVD